MNKVNIKILLTLYLDFFKIGLFTIGGGLAMMPMIQKELVYKRKWISDEELIDYFAISQSTPGIIAVNVATFVGYKQAGVLGGIIATFGVVMPSLIIILILAGIISSVDEFPIVQKALSGVNVAVAAMFTNVLLSFTKKTVKNIFSALIVVLVFIAVYILKLHSVFVMLGAILIGLIIYIAANRRS